MGIITARACAAQIGPSTRQSWTQRVVAAPMRAPPDINISRIVGGGMKCAALGDGDRRCGPVQHSLPRLASLALPSWLQAETPPTCVHRRGDQWLCPVSAASALIQCPCRNGLKCISTLV